MNQKNNNFKKLAIGSVIAATAGYIAGLLTAPKSGRETRADIKNTADKGLAEAEKELKKVQAELDKLINEAKTRGSDLSDKTQAELGKLVDRAKQTKDKAGQVLGAIHQGEAEDKDLAKAIKDGQKALDHLKDYLKK